MNVSSELTNALTKGTGLTLDVDATVIEADKGDAEFTYKEMRGYQPLLAACVELGLFVNTRFQHGNVNTQGDLVSFIEECRKLMPSRIETVRSDSAGYNHQVVNHCFENRLYFTITADHDVSVMESITRIGKNGWERGKNEDGSVADYDVAETIHSMQKSKEAFRLVIKRTDRGKQSDLFEGGYHYWIIATNIPKHQRDADAIIHFHNKRGEMERMIGELKNHYNMEHFPCGQFSANSLYFAVGVFSFAEGIPSGQSCPASQAALLRQRLAH